MDAKYYTPAIEEFHVGFEYEFHGMTTGGLTLINSEEKQAVKIKEPDTKVWTKEFYSENPLFSRSTLNIKDLINENRVRVKYLDREDIEELGWEHKETNDFGGLVFARHNDLHATFDVPLITYKLELLNECIFLSIKVGSTSWGPEKKTMDQQRFDVKNKSELKRLMVQLGITK